jgi:hypothetical protein
MHQAPEFRKGRPLEPLAQQVLGATDSGSAGLVCFWALHTPRAPPLRRCTAPSLPLLYVPLSFFIYLPVTVDFSDLFRRGGATCPYQPETPASWL